MNYFFQAMQVMAIASAWLMKAGADGKITVDEVAELGTQVAVALGFSVVTDIDLPSGGKPFNPKPL